MMQYCFDRNSLIFSLEKNALSIRQQNQTFMDIDLWTLILWQVSDFKQIFHVWCVEGI
jgi:hypothetical protein